MFRDNYIAIITTLVDYINGVNPLSFLCPGAKKMYAYQRFQRVHTFHFQRIAKLIQRDELHKSCSCTPCTVVLMPLTA